jgi:murein DD-endopeptidase MepM/ murein hydrolase activator NlpD
MHLMTPAAVAMILTFAASGPTSGALSTTRGLSAAHAEGAAAQVPARAEATVAQVPARPAAAETVTQGRSSGLAAPETPYRPPVAGPLRVLSSFDPPPDRYGPGHRGVDLAATAGSAVLAAGAGVVRFAGTVAGRGVVVLLHADGISTEYEPVAPLVAPGQRVRAGQRIGIVRGKHRGCAPVTCVHWGARRGSAYPLGYLNPLSLLRPLGAVRLLPWS